MISNQKAASKSLALALMGMIQLGSLATCTHAAIPVQNWSRCTGIFSCAPDNVVNPLTNSPTIGNGTAENANNETVASTFPSVHLTPGQQIILTGQVKINREIPQSTSIPSGDIRFGLWNAVNPNAGAATGWLGYLANVGSGSGTGNLEVRNPDDINFNAALFVSDFGGSAIATTAGPVPTCNAGQTCSPNQLNPLLATLSEASDISKVNYGQTSGRYFRLNQSMPTQFAVLQYNTNYNFSMRIRRLTATNYEVSASLGDQSTFAWSVGATADFDGLFPPAVVGGNPVPFTSHLTADFNRVGLLFGGGAHAASAQLTNVVVNVVPEPGAVGLLLMAGLSTVAFRGRFRRA
jgi:hypothetical protein